LPLANVASPLAYRPLSLLSYLFVFKGNETLLAYKRHKTSLNIALATVNKSAAAAAAATPTTG
jgi:hypothetical protein